MTKLLSASLVLAFTISANATFVESNPSQKIAEAIKMMKPMAHSGIQTHKVKSANTIKGWMYNLAVVTKSVETPSEFAWVGKSDDAWGADSMKWGETTMKEAYAYITSFEDGYLENLEENEKAKALKNQKQAKENFKLLMNTGVLFGVAPLGAVQCGTTFAALAIIDPHTGKIYLFAKEGSGC